MTATPIWLGPSHRPLLGFLHVPEGGAARGGVVVCPPFDRDYMHAHYALRLLAEELCGRGLCVLRLDYDGTGDSAGGPHDPGRVDAWLASVAAGLAAVRATGVPGTALVGMRIGATLAGVAAARDGGVDALVLWDPVASGRAYLAEQRALAALAFGGRPGGGGGGDGSVETPG
ncbi:MAG: esterase, partial [Acidimicrobiales bacterium]